MTAQQLLDELEAAAVDGLIKADLFQQLLDYVRSKAAIARRRAASAAVGTGARSAAMHQAAAAAVRYVRAEWPRFAKRDVRMKARYLLAHDPDRFGVRPGCEPGERVLRAEVEASFSRDPV